MAFPSFRTCMPQHHLVICEVLYGHNTLSGRTEGEVTSVLITAEACSVGGSSCQRPIAEENTTTFVLLTEHVNLTPKYSCLYLD